MAYCNRLVHTVEQNPKFLDFIQALARLKVRRGNPLVIVSDNFQGRQTWRISRQATSISQR